VGRHSIGTTARPLAAGMDNLGLFNVETLQGYKVIYMRFTLMYTKFTGTPPP
jgi:hypothetical protein